MGERPVACPWWAFRDPDVALVLRAHDFWPSLSEYWGPDFEAWAIEGAQHYHRALDRARVDAVKTETINRSPPRVPPGFEVMEEIRG